MSSVVGKISVYVRNKNLGTKDMHVPKEYILTVIYKGIWNIGYEISVLSM